MASGTLTRVTFDKTVQSFAPLRTTSVTGFYSKEPTVGYMFVIQGEPLDPALDFRLVQTSAIVSVERVTPSIVVFKTLSGSQYQLEIIDEETHTDGFVN